MADRKAVRLRQGFFALGTSVAAVAVATANPARAQCAPDPTVDYGQTICSGTDSDGLQVTGLSVQVSVEEGAVVNAGSDAGAITISGLNTWVTINGQVDGGGVAGLALVPGIVADPGYGTSSANISVAEGGIVTGAQALLMTRGEDNATGYIEASVTNAGQMTGTAGPALVNNAGPDSMLTVTNSAEGSIAGIAGAAYVTNHGSIEGGTGSAIVTQPSRFSAGTAVSNFGTISSSGNAPTISSTGPLWVQNFAGGVLGGSTTAIQTGGALTLDNSGTINGSVISTAAAGENSTIDTRLGTINGDLLLGAGDDTLLIGFDPATGLFPSVAGRIDGGGGTDKLVLGFEHDATLASFVRPDNFEALGLDVGYGTTVVLAPGFAIATGIGLAGDGTLVNQANLAGSGPLIQGEYGSYALTLRNEANLVADLADGYQYAVQNISNLVNDGNITAHGGGGVLVDYNLANSGTITATDFAVQVYSGNFSNSGTIRSQQGVGASFYGDSYSEGSINSGLITGATTGVIVSGGKLVNTGTISGADNGVLLSGTFRNEQGGIVNGGVKTGGYYVRMSNAGTINGSVIFSGISGNDDFSDDFFVDAGGVVNGTISLGGGNDLLVVDLVSDPDRPFAGATGGVDAGGGYDTLRYRVNADAETTLELSHGFEGLSYELANGAALSLTAPQPINTSVGLIGNGSVILGGEISGSDRALITTNIPTTQELLDWTASPESDLSITSNGTLTLTLTDTNSWSAVAAVVAGTAEFTNNGAIAVDSAAGGFTPGLGVMGGALVTNTGSITLTGGGTGINYASIVVNSGTITDTDLAGAAGVLNFGLLDNSGTIRVDGNAVGGGNGGYFPQQQIANTGTIESRRGKAVSMVSYGSQLTNSASGTIIGPIAVDITRGGTIINSGSIVGDVAVDPDIQYYLPSTIYIADGGTLTGNLSYGGGDDFFVMTGAGSGVSGIIDGGSGNNTFGHVISSSAGVSLSPGGQFINFQHALVRAVGANTVATITGAEPFAGQLLLSGDGRIVNAGTLAGEVRTGFAVDLDGVPAFNQPLAAFENRGEIAAGFFGTVGEFSNKGIINGQEFDSGLSVNIYSDDAIGFDNDGLIRSGVSVNSATSISADNSGTISANNTNGAPALALALNAYSDMGDVASGTLVNSGLITAGELGSAPSFTAALQIYSWAGADVAITNTATGLIEGKGANRSGLNAFNTALTIENAGIIRGANVAISASGDRANSIYNSGTLDGVVVLDAGSDRVENKGVITGPVFLRDGDDVFIQHAGATLGGLVDGGSGTNHFIVNASSDGAIAASQLTGFQHLTQTGSGSVAYSGTFAVDAIDLQGGTLAVAAGQTLATAGATTIIGGDAGVAVRNLGSIAGDVQLGAGNDSFTEGAGSAVGNVDGGEGVDLHRVILAGDRTGISASTGFEQLAVEGTGTLTLALSQNYELVALSGTGLNASLGDFSIGRIAGSAEAERVVLDADVADVSLGGGDDYLAISSTTLAGRYDGGAGADVFAVDAEGPVSLTGSVTGFETFALTGQALTVGGTLGAAADRLTFGDDGLALDLLSGGAIAGTITFGAGDDTFRIAGNFTGSVVGGGGNNVIEVAAGSSTSPVAFGSISDIALLRMNAGLATISDHVALDAVNLNGGRLIGLAGSTITAPTISVAQGATFGSAGTVNGNVVVAGTLSPGASPGTMTVNGDVTLAGTSTSVFEITSTVSDRLIVNGALAISQGATLELVADQAVAPGRSLDLITASDGITGGFGTIIKPASLFGFVVQRDNTITLLGQFLNDAGYSQQVRGAIDYTNAVLISGTGSSAFLAALPDLVTGSGAANQAAFARLTPEAYASAGQIAVQQGLELAGAGRSEMFGARRDTPGGFTFASALGSTHTLKGGSAGAARARTNSYGFLGGIGWSGGDWSIGAFAGYLDSRQSIAGLNARTEADGFVAGVHGRWSQEGGFGIKATLAYSGGDATTRRALPGVPATNSAQGNYDLTSWTGDLVVDYALPISNDWAMQPSVGVTAIRTQRQGVTETGGSPFALSVARERENAVFMDGGVTFRGGLSEGAVLQPYLSIGVRYQLEGRTPFALSALGGGAFGLEAAGAERARVLATATVGADVVLSSRLTLFGALSGEDGDSDNHISGRTGLRLAF